MIKEAYVSFEVAKLLKKKGFDEPCQFLYFSKYKQDGNFVGNFNARKNSEINEESYSAPTHQMAVAWLREVHNMYYEIHLLLGEKAEEYAGLQLGIYQLNSSGAYVWKDWIYADTYIELYENYIKYCLENLI